jgi:hypothetical protein
MTRRSRCSAMSCSRSCRTTSSAPRTPTTPSKRPPDSTVSVCEPVTNAAAAGLRPGSTPTRFPAASVWTSRPASRIRDRTHPRDSRYGSEKTVLVQPPLSGSRIRDRSRRSRSTRSATGARARARDDIPRVPLFCAEEQVADRPAPGSGVARWAPPCQCTRISSRPPRSTSTSACPSASAVTVSARAPLVM